MVTVKKELLGPCGFYCGVCAVYIAHRDNNLKFKKALTVVYPGMTKVEDIQCTGCLSDGIQFELCKGCAYKKCLEKKGLQGCRFCDEFPCKQIKNNPIPLFVKVVQRANPEWKSLGTEKWVESEEKRYRCPECDNPLFRGAKRCNKCKIPVNVD